MVRVVWSPEAIRNVEAVRIYLSEFNPRAAERLVERIYASGEGLRALPDRGRPVGRGRRQLVIAQYLLTFRADADAVLVLRVRHAARRR